MSSVSVPLKVYERHGHTASSLVEDGFCLAKLKKSSSKTTTAANLSLSLQLSTKFHAEQSTTIFIVAEPIQQQKNNFFKDLVVFYLAL